MLETERESLDPVTTEIIRGLLVATTDEMKNNLMRTAYSHIIYEALDFTVGLFDSDGNTVSIGLGLPMFIRGLSETIRAKIAHFGKDGIEPGDILLTNDAYITGSHLNHMVLTLPIYCGGRLIAFASTMAHWQDVGGALGTVTQDIFAEGLQVPIVKLFKRGEPDTELLDIIRANVRFPDLASGDIRAQIAAIKTGQRRMEAMVERYGADTVADTIRELSDHSERLARSGISSMPDGVYEASSFMDDDGFGDEPLPIHVKVTVSGDEMEVDLSEISPQVRGYLNSGRTAGLSAAEVAFKCLTTPEVYPINEGAFRPLKVVLPEGKLVSALKPAAMQRWMVVPMTIIDTIFHALTPAIPERVVAGHHADLLARTIFGVDPRSTKFFARSVGVIGGGWGAKRDEDGVSGTICINDGDTHNSPIEATEIKLPIRVERYALRVDSGGPGRYRGGLGVEQRVRLLFDGGLGTAVERTKCAPWGLEGGLPGLSNRVRLETSEGLLEFRNGKLSGRPVVAGDVFVVESGGGGGFGYPWTRDVDAVVTDVRAGYVSVESAEKEYGVVISDGVVDVGLTERRRAELATRAEAVNAPEKLDRPQCANQGEA